jgi:hypothetical protein
MKDDLLFGNEEKEKKLRPKRILGAYKQSHIFIFKQNMKTSNIKAEKEEEYHFSPILHFPPGYSNETTNFGQTTIVSSSGFGN